MGKPHKSKSGGAATKEGEEEVVIMQSDMSIHPSYTNLTLP